jgi:hypothetical protein
MDEQDRKRQDEAKGIEARSDSALFAQGLTDRPHVSLQLDFVRCAPA